MIEWGAVMDHAIFLNRLRKVGLAVSTGTPSPATIPSLIGFPNNLSLQIGFATGCMTVSLAHERRYTCR